MLWSCPTHAFSRMVLFSMMLGTFGGILTIPPCSLPVKDIFDLSYQY